MRTALMLLVVLACLLPGCARTHGMQSNPPPAMASGAGRETVLLTIESMPKAEFLKAVSASPRLSDEDKGVIRQAISPDVYMHCRLVKGQRGGQLFLEVDQFYPSKIVGQDAAGHLVKEGGSGSRARYEWRLGRWSLTGAMNYD